MAVIFANHGFTGQSIVSKDAYRPLLHDKFDIRPLLQPYRQQYIDSAASMLDTPYPMLNASTYMQFIRNGNRSNYENLYFTRRSMLATFVMAELCEGEGRFVDRIIDGVWHIMEESTWIIPAHNWSGKPVTGDVVSLPDTYSSSDGGDDMKHIDLFSAGTGGEMAWIWYLTGNILDRENPVIRQRMLSQLKQRILHPFYTYYHDWWMGRGKRLVLNNWTPWITSNVLTVIALCEEDDEKRRFGAEKAMEILDRYTLYLPDDGGCDEGTNYWGSAYASYFDCLELLYDMSEGEINVFDEPIVRRMCEYVMHFSISSDTYVNFSDASSKNHPDFRLIARIGRKLGSERLSAFASTIVHNPGVCGLEIAKFCRFISNLAEPIPENQTFVPEEQSFYKNLQVAITREPGNGFFLAFKGGSNGESHNHNDVGQFILFDGGKPIILDAGVDEYTKVTFSDQRYTLWAMRGNYHNIANIAGVEQQPGGSYRAELVSYDENTGSMTLELRNAYPVDAHIASYRRTAVLKESCVTITDDLHLMEPGAVALHYITPDLPQIDGNKIVFSSGHQAAFDHSLLVSVEKIDLGGGKIAREWQRETLYRITLGTETPIKDAVYIMTFTRT